MSLVKIYPNRSPYRASNVCLQLGAEMGEAGVAGRGGEALGLTVFTKTKYYKEENPFS